jgi:CHAT domain-containing protein/Tfp pilus assembly protein PilF
MEQATASLKRGAFAEAISSWSKAARLFEERKETAAYVESLTKLSQAYQGAGQYQEALKAAQRALLLAQQDKNEKQTAEAMCSMGNILTTLGEGERGRRLLEEGLRIAEPLGDADLRARLLNNLGNLLAAQKRFEEALQAYQDSALAVREGATGALALVNSATACLTLGDYSQAKSRIDKALLLLRDLEDSYYKAHALINAGLLYSDLRRHLPDQAVALTALSSEALAQAVRVSQAIGDSRTLSYAYGFLGSLYESEGRPEDALTLTSRAILCAQRSQAPESLYRWYWQSGRVLRSLGKSADAIAAYRQALVNIQTIRKEMAVCTGDSDSSFRSAAALLCSQYVDLLLEHASSAENPQLYLTEAREALELVKVFELRDYFKDDCVDAARYAETRLDLLSRNALIIYPILLKDRLELLVRFPDSLKRFTVKVSAEELTREVREFRSKVEKRTTYEFLPHAQTLYNWLIRPFEKDLSAYPISTLVFVPDGSLRTIPMAALHSGKKFLIQEYATAVTPGLNLTDPRPLRTDQVKLLTFGLTESVQDFPALPYVSAELQEIGQVFSGRSLVNQDFVASRVEEELRREPFSILHIASHGHFGNEVEDTFLLAFDTKLTMDRLGAYVGLFRFREEPLDLLTLSACETAAGDDRAALGLAGIAIRAGARSALATLWQVNDPASYRLVVEFYRQLRNPGVSRASALQAAQLALIEDPLYGHPCYWAPFLLINNWL